MSWAGKQRNILDFTLSSLFRRKGRNAALVFVYAFVVFLLASVVFLAQSIKEEAKEVLRDAPEIVVQRLVAGRHDMIPETYIGKIRGIPGVQSVRARLWGYYYEPLNGANYTVIADEEYPYEKGTVVIGNGVARHLPPLVGKTMPMRTYGGTYLFLRIRETLSSESELVSSDLILMSVDDFRKLFRIPAGVGTDLVLSVRNPREVATVAGKVVEILPDTRPITRPEVLRTYDAVFDWRGGMIVANLIGALMAFVIFAWDKATGLSAEERREIGVLKGLGWETSDVILMKFWEGVVVSLSSFFLGVILAYVHVFFASATLFESALKGWSILYPDFRLKPVITPYLVSVLFFLTVVPYTFATIVPSWRAATTDPDAVMRA
jgi:ABC-type lipoprotein release transport system permease subunit